MAQSSDLYDVKSQLSEAKLHELKIEAAANGSFEDKFFADRDDDGKYPRRNGESF